MWYPNSAEQLFSLKIEGNLIHATTWMTLADTVLSEINQAREDEYCMIACM